MRSSMLLLNTKLFSLLKNSRNGVWRSQNSVTFADLSRQFHCCSRDANNSALLLGKCRSFIRSFNLHCVILYCYVDSSLLKKSGWISVQLRKQNQNHYRFKQVVGLSEAQVAQQMVCQDMRSLTTRLNPASILYRKGRQRQ